MGSRSPDVLVNFFCMYLTYLRPDIFVLSINKQILCSCFALYISILVTYLYLFLFIGNFFRSLVISIAGSSSFEIILSLVIFYSR